MLKKFFLLCFVLTIFPPKVFAPPKGPGQNIHADPHHRRSASEKTLDKDFQSIAGQNFYSERCIENHQKEKRLECYDNEQELISSEVQYISNVVVPKEHFMLLGTRWVDWEVIECLGPHLTSCEMKKMYDPINPWQISFFQSQQSDIVYGMMFRKTLGQSASLEDVIKNEFQNLKIEAEDVLNQNSSFLERIREENWDKEFHNKNEERKDDVEKIKSPELICKKDINFCNNMMENNLHSTKNENHLSKIHFNKTGPKKIKDVKKTSKENCKKNEIFSDTSLVQKDRNLDGARLSCHASHDEEKDVIFFVDAPRIISAWLETPQGCALSQIETSHDFDENIVIIDAQELVPKVCFGLVCCKSLEEKIRKNRNKNVAQSQIKKINDLLNKEIKFLDVSF